MKKRILSLIMVLCVTACSIPSFASEAKSIGPWIADFSKLTVENGNIASGTHCKDSGCYVNIPSNGTGWTYSKDDDCITGGKELHLYFGEEMPRCTEDYTFGFKINPGTNGENNYNIHINKMVVKDSSGDYVSVNIDSIYPAVLRYRSNFFRVTNDLSCIDPHSYDTVDIVANTWHDLRFEVDYPENEASSDAFSISTYIDNEKIQKVAVPLSVSMSSVDYTAIALDALQIKCDISTKIKDIYMYPGTSYADVTPGTVTDASKTEVNNVIYADFNDNKADDYEKLIDLRGASVSYDNGCAEVSFTKNSSDSEVTDHVTVRSTPTVYADRFIYEASYKIHDFHFNRDLVTFRIGKTDSDTNGTSLSAILKLYTSSETFNVNNTTVCKVALGNWYHLKVDGYFNEENKLAYNVRLTGTDADGKSVNFSTSFVDTDADNNGSTTRKVRWNAILGSKKSMNELDVGKTAAVSMDNINFTCYTLYEKDAVNNIKAYQGNSFITANGSYNKNEALKISALLSNTNTASTQPSTLMLAEYTSDNELLQLIPVSKELSKATSAASYTDILGAALTPSANSHHIKLFVMDSQSSIIPLSKSVCLTASTN